MRPDVVGELPGEVTLFVKYELEGVDHDANELHHLQCRHVLFPPGVLLVAGSHGRQHVVQVHADVDEGIEEAEERGVTSSNKTCSNPD